MNFSDALIQRFLELCPIPELHSGMGMGAIAIEVKYSPPYLAEIVIHCQNVFLALQISAHYNVLKDAVQELRIAAVSVYLSDRLFRSFMNEPLLDSVRQEIMENQGLQEEENRRFMETLKRHEIDMNDFCRSLHPGYIIAMHDEMLLLANNAALKANQKTLDQFVGENLATLNFPEEMEKKNRLLRRDKKLTNYEFKAMNWYKDGKDWRRKQMNLVSDIQLIEFGGITCRFCIDVMAEETNRFID